MADPIVVEEWDVDDEDVAERVPRTRAELRRAEEGRRGRATPALASGVATPAPPTSVSPSAGSHAGAEEGSGGGVSNPTSSGEDLSSDEQARRTAAWIRLRKAERKMLRRLEKEAARRKRREQRKAQGEKIFLGLPPLVLVRQQNALNDANAGRRKRKLALLDLPFPARTRRQGAASGERGRGLGRKGLLRCLLLPVFLLTLRLPVGPPLLHQQFLFLATFLPLRHSLNSLPLLLPTQLRLFPSVRLLYLVRRLPLPFVGVPPFRRRRRKQRNKLTVREPKASPRGLLRLRC